MKQVYYSFLRELLLLRVFSKSTGIDNFINKRCYQSNTAKQKRKVKKFHRLAAIALSTIFVTIKNLNEFIDRKDFEIGAISAVVDNYAIATDLNDTSLFVGKLTKISDYRIITIGRTNYKPTHIGTTKLLIKDDDSNISVLTILRALYFPSSLVNILSIGKLSLLYDNGKGNNNKYIKSTYNRSYFS